MLNFLRQRRFPVWAALSFIFLSACSSYTRNTRAGLDAFANRDFATAEAVYAKADEEGVDQLVYLFDRATVR